MGHVAIPSYRSGFYSPKRGGIPRWPSLWRGCVGAWCPSLGQTGLRLMDQSLYANHGTLTTMDAATDWVVSGGVGALDFDGSSDHATTSSAVSFANGVSVSAWVQWRNIGSAIYYPMIFCVPGAASWTSPFATVSLRIAGNIQKLAFGVNSLASGANIIEGATTISVDSRWHHVVGTFDGKTLLIFLDGKQDGSKALSASLSSSTFSPIIGARQGTGEWFDGLKDDIRIYNRALSEPEIRLLARRRGIAYETRRNRSVIAPAGGGSFKSYLAARNSQLIGGGT